MNTTTKLELREISTLRPYANNARIHSPAQIEQLRRSLREFGFVSPVLIDADGNVLAGHGRLEAAKVEGLTQVPCVLVEHLTETQRRAYILADNRLAEHASWDESLVSGELLALRDAGMDLTLTGFAASDIALTPTTEVQEDSADLTPPEEPVTQPGWLWRLGRHRLLCGDATSADDVLLSIGGGQVDLLLTDPPYGVSYSPAKGSSRPLLNDDKRGAALYDFLYDAYSASAAVMAPGAAWYSWAPSGDSLEYFLTAARAAGLPVHQILVWVKPSAVLSRTDYHGQNELCLHGCTEKLETLPASYDEAEPILYGWKPGAPHLWCSDRKQTTVLEFDRPTRSEQHPTMKPVRLVAYQLCNNTLPGARVLDPFGGSGTTLIACEQTGRSCCMLELSPAYCDVIVRRWEALTGEKAVRIDA